MKLLVLDGNSILNRAFYGIKLLTTKDGLFTNAIYGFMNILLKLEEAEKPDEIAVAFDLKAPTFRHELYDGYKAKRKGMPEELAAQMPVLKELLALLGYVEVSLAGYEADDILGTLSKAASLRGDEALLATGDRDSLQLIRDGVTVLLTATKGGKGETTRMDEAAVFEKYGVSPKQLIETKALMGDASDNIPGVPGVGEKTAFSLIKDFGTLQEVYENIDSDTIKAAVQNKLKAGKDSAFLSYKLAVIDCDVPIDTAAGAYKKKPADKEVALSLLAKLEMHNMISRLSLSDDTLVSQENTPASTLNLPKVSPVPFKDQVAAGVAYLAPCEDGWLVVPSGTFAVYHTQENSDELLCLLRNNRCEKRVFDAKALHRMALGTDDQTNPCQNITFDAKLAAYLLHPASPKYTVESLCAEYDISPQFICKEYPDAALLHPLFTHLKSECDKAQMMPLLLDIEQPLAEVLASMELYGVGIDATALKTFGEDLKIKIDKQLEFIYQTVGYEFNVNSPKQLGEALFEKMGLPTRKKTKTGYSTDAETLESLRAYSPVIDEILQYRTYQKLLSTYVEGLGKVIESDGRIHSVFNQTEARTGRISSSEPNLQNIPVRTELGSHMRAFFVAPEGEVFADADYSQIELRILADISNDTAMKQAFLDGEDIHKATAALVNGLPLNMVTPQLRGAAKAVNFGIVYGIGAFSLSKDIGVSVKEAGEFIDSYLASFPGVKDYMEKTVEFGKEHGYVQTLYGRRRAVPELSASNRNIQALGKRIALNTPIQGTAADIIKLAMIRVWQRLHREKLSARLVLQVHDELIVQTPNSEIDTVKTILKEEMENAFSMSIPLSVDVHTGENWLKAKG